MCILELCKEEHSPEPLFRNGHPLCCSVGGCNTFLCHQYQCPRVFVYFSCPSPTDIIWSKVPVCCVERDRSHLFMPVEVGSLQVGCVAAWFTAARNQVDISKCCRPVNKTLTCTLSWHLKPSHIQTTWTLKKDTYSLARSQIKDKWEQLRASCGHLIFPLRSKKKSRLIFYVWAVRWTNKKLRCSFSNMAGRLNLSKYLLTAGCSQMKPVKKLSETGEVCVQSDKL